MHTSPSFTFSKVVNASPNIVYSAFTLAQHLDEWFTPDGMTLIHSQLNCAIDGMYHYGWRSEDGFEIWAKKKYQEIIENEKLIYLQAFSDSEGNIIRTSMINDWPILIRVETRFELTNDGATLIIEDWQPINATSAELSVFVNTCDSMKQGFEASYKKLEIYLNDMTK